MFLNSDSLDKKPQENKPTGGLLLNFDDDDEDEEENQPAAQPQQKPTQLKITSSKSYEQPNPVTVFKNKEPLPLKINTNTTSQTTQNFSNTTIPKSSGLPSNINKSNDTNTKSSGLPPSLASKLAALNAKNNNNNPPQNNAAPKKENFLYCNEDEFEDISKKYDSPNKGLPVLEKPKAENTELYSRFKLGSPSLPATNNILNHTNSSDNKNKNEALNAKQKLLEQNKQLFLEKQKLQMKQQSVITTNSNYKTNFDNLKGFLPAEKPELDYDKLSVLVPKNENYYEPGKQVKEPVVTKLTQQEKEKMKNITPTTLKLAAFSDDEEEKIDDNILKEAQKIKMKNKQVPKEEMMVHTSRNTNRNKKNDEEIEKEEDEKKEKNKPDQDKDEEKNEEEDEDDCNFGDAKPDPTFEVYDMRTFLTKPAPPNLLVQCSIKRDKSGFGRFFPKYHLYLSNGLKYLMSAKKRANNKTSNYLMSMNKDLKKKSSSYLGKLRSNFLGTEFIVYDTGLNPKETSDFPKMRLQLGVILYESNLLGERGPRKMRVLIPELKGNGEYLEWRPTSNKDGMIANYNDNNFDGMKVFANKEPQWNEEVQAFVLNFNGRVDKPSVKNFQLVDANDNKIIYMQFGRVGDSVFNLDYQYPFSALQAFAICLSSFDYKIACE